MAGGRIGGAAAVLLLAAAPAIAAGVGTVSIVSDAVFRGRTLSDGRPVAALAGSHDWRSGFHAGAEVLAVSARDDGVRFLGVSAEAGYARRLAGGATIDAGIIHRAYSAAYTPGVAAGFTEAYAGLSRGPLNVRLAFSPDYFDRGAAALHAGADVVRTLGGGTRLNLGGGVLIVLEEAPATSPLRSRWDARAGLSRDFGRLAIDGAVHAIGPAPDRLRDGAERRVTATLGARFAF